jgi:hypothetical protein
MTGGDTSATQHNRFEYLSKLDDSALGRFRTSIGSSRGVFDYEQLTHARSTSPRSSSKNSPEELLLDLEYDDDGETMNLSPTASQMGSGRSSPDFNDLETSDTSPNVTLILINSSTASYRLIRPSPTMGPAPFIRPHFVSSSPLPPFSGLHTALSIPFGPDLESSYIHLPLTLRASYINLADLAIFYLWSGHRRDDTFSPVLPKRRQTTGPPQAPYPMTQKTFAQYLGPRTCVVNYGKKANGWILHVPRYLAPKEVAVATKNLRDIADRDEWNVHGGGVKREGKELEMLEEKLKEQEWEMKFLEEVMGLDFGALDEEDAVFVPIWVGKDDVQRDDIHKSDEADAAFTKATELHDLDMSADLPLITLDSSVKQQDTELIFDSPANNVSFLDPDPDSLALAIVATSTNLQSLAVEGQSSDTILTPKTIYATPSPAISILRKVAFLTLLALASMYASWVVFNYVLWLQSCIILPSLILKHRDAFVVAAVLLGPFLWIAIGYVCSAKVRGVVCVVVWACVGASQVIMVRNWESLILAQEWMRGV